jgi:hypothetical protein
VGGVYLEQLASRPDDDAVLGLAYGQPRVVDLEVEGLARGVREVQGSLRGVFVK